MPDPSLEVLCSGGQAKFFRAYRGGPRVATRLVLGPPYTPSGSPTPASALQREAFGGVLVDREHRLVRWFGLDVMSPHRRVLNALFAVRWPGWNVAHAPRGLADFAAHLGLASPPLEPPNPKWGPTHPPSTTSCHALLTGVIRGVPLTAILGAADDFDVFYADLERAAQYLSVHGRPGVVHVPEFPIEGLHIDPESRTASIWSAGEDDTAAEIRLLNPAWTVVDWLHNPERHIACAPQLVWPVLDDQLVLATVVKDHVGTGAWRFLCSEAQAAGHPVPALEDVAHFWAARLAKDHRP